MKGKASGRAGTPISQGQGSFSFKDNRSPRSRLGPMQSKMLNKPKIPPGGELTLTMPRYPCHTFADRLRAYRRERGWRQVDLARALGVNKDTVRNWEAGRVAPRLAVLGRKAKAIVRKLLGRAPGDDGATPGLQPHSNHSS